jgi:ubiquinol-cytochrome c reductase cytochrome c1 subunit
MERRLTAALGAAILGLGLALAGPASDLRASEGAELPDLSWGFHGVFGTFDRAALQRGFQVYEEICANCHGVKYLYYRNLKGIGFDKERVKEVAAEYDVIDGPDETGEMYERSGIPSDRIVEPYPNAEAARDMNGGALPPDLSLMVKARDGGANYLYGFLTGYEEEAPEDAEEMMEGLYYNHYFPGNQTAMPPPLYDDAVEYEDGTEATTEQLARDITTFLAWTAEPELEERKRLGIKVILFLLVFTGLLYAVKRKVWAGLH